MILASSTACGCFLAVVASTAGYAFLSKKNFLTALPRCAMKMHGC